MIIKIIFQTGYPPVIIRKQDRMLYYNHLQTANEGDTRPFVRFIAHCADKTLDVYLWATKEHFPEIEQKGSLTEDKVFKSSEDDSEDINSSKASVKEEKVNINCEYNVDGQCEDKTTYIVDSEKETLYTMNDFVNSGDSWLQGNEEPKKSILDKEEYVQFKNYKSSLKGKQIKRPIFYFDDDNEILDDKILNDFSSDGR